MNLQVSVHRTVCKCECMCVSTPKPRATGQEAVTCVQRAATTKGFSGHKQFANGHTCI